MITIVAILIALLCHHYFNSDWFEVAGFITGIVAVYLTAIEHIISWPIGITNVLIYAWVFHSAGLLADRNLQFFFCALSIHGWISWWKGGEEFTELKISKLSTKQWIIALACLLVGTALYKPVIEHFKGAQPLWDTILAVASMIAQYMLNRKVIENWLWWMLINLAYIPLYLKQNLIPTAILYGIFLVLAILGWSQWHRNLRETPNLTEPLVHP